MSQENVKNLRAAYTAWNRQDLDQFLTHISPRVVFHTAGIFPSHDPVYHGHDGIRNFWQIFHDAWGRLDIQPSRIEDLDDRALALIHFEAVGRGSGVEVRRKLAHVLTFEDGLCIEVHAYADWAEAIEAVGLRE